MKDTTLWQEAWLLIRAFFGAMCRGFIEILIDWSPFIVIAVAILVLVAIITVPILYFVL